MKFLQVTRRTTWRVKPTYGAIGSVLTSITSQWLEEDIVKTYTCYAMCPFMGAKWRDDETGEELSQDMSYEFADHAQAALPAFFKERDRLKNNC